MSERDQKTGLVIALVGVVLAVAFQFGATMLYFGRMDERVTQIQKTTQTLLDLQLQKTAEAKK